MSFGDALYKEPHRPFVVSLRVDEGREEEMMRLAEGTLLALVETEEDCPARV